MRGFLWLCAGALAPTVGNSVTTLTQDRSTTKTLAFGRCSLLCLFRFDFMTCSPCTVSFPTSLCPCSLLLCWLLRGQMAFDALLVDGDFFARSSLLRSALSHLVCLFRRCANVRAERLSLSEPREMRALSASREPDRGNVAPSHPQEFGLAVGGWVTDDARAHALG